MENNEVDKLEKAIAVQLTFKTINDPITYSELGNSSLLDWAIEFQNLEIVNLLVCKYKADVNSSDPYSSILCSACF